MKRKIQYIIMVLAFVLSASAVKSQQVGLTILPQGTQPYTAGYSFQVYANYNYSNISGNVVITISFNNTTLSFCGSPSFPVAPTYGSTGSTTTLTYTFPAVSGNNQTGVIMLCFSYLCPSTCFGNSIPSTLNGTISAPANSLTTNATSVTVTGMVVTRTGYHGFFSFIQSSYEITFVVTVQNGTCFKITNPVFTVTPSVGTLASVTNGTVSGNNFTPTNTTDFEYWNNYVYYYTIKIPCNTPAGTVVTSNVVLKGSNCGNPNVTIINYSAASYILPVVIPSNPSATLNVTATGTYFRTEVSNNGNTPLNLTLTNNIPNVNTTSITQNTSQPSLSSVVNYFDCLNTASGSSPALVSNSSTPVTTAYLKKAVVNITNLLPGHYVYHYYYFNLTNSCVGPPSQSNYPMTTNMTYNCTTTGLSQVCYNCGPGTGNVTDTAVYVLQPFINCIYQNSPQGCLQPGDTMNLCLSFNNSGSAPLTSGVVNFNLQNIFTYLPGNDIYTGFSTNPVYQPSTSVKWNIPAIPVGSGTYKICFKAVVNSNAPYGSYSMNYSVTGNNYSQQLNCYQTVNVCALPKAEVEKLIKGDKDNTFGTSGNGTPGSTALFQITVKNTGNTTIGNVILIDRFPFNLPSPGDKTIMTCTARNSQFQLFPSGTLAIPGTTVQYSSVPNHKTGLPTTVAACNLPADTWSNSFSPNNAKISLTANIAPGNSFTFTIPVVIPPGTPIGKIACNSIGMICDLIDNAGNASQMNPVESNNVCLEVVEKDPPPPSGCCRDFLKKITAQHTVSNGVLSVNTTMTVGPQLVTKASVSLVDFHILHPKDCDMCLKDPKYMGNIVNTGGSTFTWNNLPSGVPWSHLIQWNDSLGQNWGNGIPLNFQIPLPPKSPISCCCDSILYCLKYSFTDINCNTCDTVICYKVPCTTTTQECKCDKWKDGYVTVKPQGNGTPINIKCDGTSSLNGTGIYQIIAAGYMCNPLDCQPLYKWNIQGPSGVQGNGTGNPFTFNFSVTGTYVVTITPKCGSQDCQPCKFVIEINKSSNKTAGNVNNYGINDEGIKKEVSSVQDGEPTPGIEVYVEQEPNKEPIANVVTDENGEIEIVVSRNSELPASGFFSFTIIPSKAFISKSKLPASFKEIIMVPYTRNITGKYRFVLKWIANPEMQKSNKGSFAVSGRNST
jgi:uncharacterized repeat protein (TIGR01451 family)